MTQDSISPQKDEKTIRHVRTKQQSKNFQKAVKQLLTPVEVVVVSDVIEGRIYYCAIGKEAYYAAQGRTQDEALRAWRLGFVASVLLGAEIGAEPFRKVDGPYWRKIQPRVISRTFFRYAELIAKAHGER